MKAGEIIAEIEKLVAIRSFDGKEIEQLISQYSYEPIQHYLRALQRKSKPETATGELLDILIKDVLGKRTIKEISTSGGFADFAFQESVQNPVVLELKPLFERGDEKFSVYKFFYGQNTKQVKKYLQENQFVILTNINQCFLFNRESLVDFKPFLELPFTDFLKFFQQTDNLWDAVRRLEDNRVKVELEKEFFESLKYWYDEFQMVEFDESSGLSKEEIIVLLLNKIIFIKTLEDYSLIPFLFFEELYFEKRTKWEVKGEEKVFTNFFNELEDWFWDYYDTELFTTRIWDKVIKTESNIERFRKKFESVMGFGIWEQTFGKGMIHYNYRKIDEDVFGKAYETFLAERRKDEGIYYTPKPITQYMAQRLVKALFTPVADQVIAAIDQNKFEDAYTLMEQLRTIRIADTCSGSGSFLIKVLREIYEQYIRIRNKTSYFTEHGESKNGELVFEERPRFIKEGIDFRKKCFFDDLRKLVASIILNHLFAIDLDERALETAKTNIWKEAIKLEPPVFNFRKLKKDVNHILPNLSINFINADGLYDMPLDELVNELHEKHKSDIIRLHEVRRNYLKNPYDPELLDEALIIKATIRKALKVNFPLERKPTLMPLEFFFLFFDEMGTPLPKKQWGFSGIISNPPWEAIKPVKKEFARIDKMEMDILHFDEWFEKKLKKDERFSSEWAEYTDFYKQYNKFLNSRYKNQGGGDPNFYKLFIERDLELVSENGYLDILVPSGIQTDYGCGELRKMIFECYDLKEISSFENRGYKELIDSKEYSIRLFPDVDSRFKFSVVFVKHAASHAEHYFDARFYLHHPDELNSQPISYDVEMVKKFSPNNLSIMEFRSEKDYEVCKKIRSDHESLEEAAFVLSRGFDMTMDSQLFKREQERNSFPLYEGKMIFQFDNNYTHSRFFVDKKEGNEYLVSKDLSRIKRDFKIEISGEDFQRNRFITENETYKFVWRDVASSTNERSLIASLLPKNIFTGNTLNHVVSYEYQFTKDKKNVKQIFLAEERKLYLVGLFNSLILNFYLRCKITSHASMFYVYELPIPKPKKKQQSQIVELAFQLLWHFNDHALYEDLRKELNLEPKDKINPVEIRAQLEVLIARDLYGLSKNDWEYLVSTFTYGGVSETKKELEQIIKESIKMF